MKKISISDAKKSDAIDSVQNVLSLQLWHGTTGPQSFIFCATASISFSLLKFFILTYLRLKRKYGFILFLLMQMPLFSYPAFLLFRWFNTLFYLYWFPWQRSLLSGAIKKRTIEVNSNNSSSNCPSQWHPLAKTVLTPWNIRPLKIRACSTNTLLMIQEHLTLALEIISTPRDQPRKFLQHCEKWIWNIKFFEIRRHILANTLKKGPKVVECSATSIHLKSFFERSGTLTNTLPTPQKFS